jgi:Fe-S cluster biosynthesis and repair protein YggX
MYGLPIAGKLANNLLTKRIATAGYHPCQFTAGLWKHVWRPVTFTLVVDDFGVKFVGKNHAEHLEQTLKKWYDITVDWTGEKYVGITLKWDYKKRTLDTSVPDFVKNKLHKFQHPTPSKPQHAPANAAPINYGSRVQKPTPGDDSPPLSKAGIKRIQEIVGAFAWYSRSTDPTMAATLSQLAGRQAKATEQLKQEVHQFLDYCSTHPNATVRFMASDMILAIHSDASHLSEPGSKSRAAGHFYVTQKDDRDINNGTILTLSKIIKHVMGSAGESEIAALFYNCKAAIPLKIALQEMGHQQPATPTITDNSSAEGLLNKTMTPKRAKNYDLRFNWLKCREAQRQFDWIWKPGKVNRADYHSKKHPIKVYQEKRSEFVAASAA